MVQMHPLNHPNAALGVAVIGCVLFVENLPILCKLQLSAMALKKK